MDNKEIYDKTFSQWQQDIRRNIKVSGQYASGKTSASFVYTAEKDGATLFGQTYVETGRKPGKQPPLSEIYSWSRFRKYSLDWTDLSQRRQQAFLIARNIGKHGDWRHRKGGKTGVISDVINDNSINKLVDEIGSNSLIITTNSFLDGFNDSTT